MCYQITNNFNNDVEYVQDMTHIAVKLRNRLLSLRTNLTMSGHKVSIDHLRELLRNVNKSVHGLNNIDVFPIDRQNFRSFEKIVHERVVEALKNNVKDCEGTVMYLQLCYEIVSSYMDYQIPPKIRLYRIYHAVYFLRIWKNCLKSSRFYTVDKNFISNNTYTGIEINAQSMIHLIKKCRDENIPDHFLPTMFDSQTCEKAFRQLRSMGTTNLTRINFSLYELLHMIGRIEAQNYIAYFELPEGVSFPISQKRANKTKVYDLPSDIEIEDILKEAKRKAIEDALEFGMFSENIETHEFHSNQIIYENDEDEEFDEISVDDPMNQDDFSDFPDRFVENSEQPQSAFTTVVDADGKTRTIRKSTLVWILTEPGASLSKDRLRRVQVSNRQQKP